MVDCKQTEPASKIQRWELRNLIARTVGTWLNNILTLITILHLVWHW